MAHACGPSFVSTQAGLCSLGSYRHYGQYMDSKAIYHGGYAAYLAPCVLGFMNISIFTIILMLAGYVAIPVKHPPKKHQKQETQTKSEDYYMVTSHIFFRFFFFGFFGCVCFFVFLGKVVAVTEKTSIFGHFRKRSEAIG